MAGCTYNVPDVNASGDLFYGRFLNDINIKFFFGRYLLGHAKGWLLPGWGIDQPFNITQPLARLFNALYALTFSDGNDKESYDLPPLHWGSHWVYSNISQLRNKCDGGPSIFANTWDDGIVELYLPWFYECTVVERASILVHEATHCAGWGHNDFFPAGSNRQNPSNGSKQADSGWGFNAYSYEVGWLADFASTAIATTPAMRERAIFVANDLLDNCFAVHPGWSVCGPRNYGFSPAAVSMKSGRLDLFGIGDDRNMYHNVWQAKGPWSGWTADPGDGLFSSGPAAVSMSAGRIDVFALGDDRDMWHNVWEGNGPWFGWTPDTGAGSFSSGPAAVSMNSGRIDVFALGDDGQMWHDVWEGAGWSGWSADTGAGLFSSEPAAVSMRNGRIDLFALGEDRRMYHNVWEGAGWSGWSADTGEGTFSSGPAAVTMTPNRIDVFALGDDFGMWHNVWEGAGWSGWSADTGAGTFSSGPGAASMKSGRIDVFALGLDRQMWHNVWEGNGPWTGWKSDTGDGLFSGPQFPT